MPLIHISTCVWQWNRNCLFTWIFSTDETHPKINSHPNYEFCHHTKTRYASSHTQRHFITLPCGTQLTSGFDHILKVTNSHSFTFSYFLFDFKHLVMGFDYGSSQYYSPTSSASNNQKTTSAAAVGGSFHPETSSSANHQQQNNNISSSSLSAQQHQRRMQQSTAHNSINSHTSSHTSINPNNASSVRW